MNPPEITKERFFELRKKATELQCMGSPTPDYFTDPTVKNGVHSASFGIPGKEETICSFVQRGGEFVFSEGDPLWKEGF